MIVKLKNIGTIITGNTPSKKNENYYNSNDIYFIKPDVLSDSEVTILNSSNDYISNVARDKARIVGINTILVTCIGSIGKIGIVLDGEFAFNQQINAIIPNKLVIPHYLAYCLLFNKDRLIDIANAPVVPIINKSQFSEFEITINIDLEEQQKIVNILKLIQEIILKQRKLMERLDDLIKARFVEMFGEPDNNIKGWEEHALSEKIYVIGGYAFKSELFDENGGIPVLRIGNINTGYFKPANMVYWEEDKKLERYSVYPGDLVMSLTGTVGKDDYGNVCILSDDYEMYYLNQRNAKLEIKEGINKHYLAELLKFEKIKKKLTGISRGVRQANISNKDILNLIVPIPPIELQYQFADFVKQVDKSKFIQMNSTI